jgi:hypothetical protein
MGYPVGSMATLNNGFPFSDGPDRWPVRGEVRDGQCHLVCGRCDVSVFPLALALDQPGYTVTGELLKSRIADHCLKMHRDDLGDAILT